MFFGVGAVGRQSIVGKRGVQGASLDLGFMSPGVLDPRITFTRASTATYFDSTGTLQTATTNTPRWDYNPSTRALQGLLIEQARTNLTLNSGNLALFTPTAGGTSAPVLTANQVTSPDGTLTGARMVFPAVTTAGWWSFAYQSFTATATAYTFSVWLRGNAGGEQTYVYISDGTTVNARVLATLTTAWQRFSITSGNLTAATWYAEIGTDRRDASQAATGASTIYAWGAQIEPGAFPTSYIPTTAASVTRAAEAANMPIGAWYNAAAGSLVTESSYSAVNPAATTRIAQFDDNTAANNIIHIVAGTNGRQYATSTVASVIKMNLGNNSTYVANTIVKIGSSWVPDTQLFNLNGIQPQSSAVVGAIPSGITMTRFGGDQTGGCNGNIYMRRVRYWPRALSAAELQSVTA